MDIKIPTDFTIHKQESSVSTLSREELRNKIKAVEEAKAKEREAIIKEREERKQKEALEKLREEDRKAKKRKEAEKLFGNPKKNKRDREYDALTREMNPNLEEYKEESEFTKWDGKTNPLRDMDWIFHNIDMRVEKKDAPSPGAFAYLLRLQADGELKDEFYKFYITKRMPSKSEIDDMENRVNDDGRDLEEFIEKRLNRVKDLILKGLL